MCLFVFSNLLIIYFVKLGNEIISLPFYKLILTFTHLLYAIYNRWLEQNIRNSNSVVFLIVGVIILFAVLYSIDLSAFNLSPALLNTTPIIIVVFIIALFVWKRYTTGPQYDQGMDEITFNTMRNHDNSNPNLNQNLNQLRRNNNQPSNDYSYHEVERGDGSKSNVYTGIYKGNVVYPHAISSNPNK